MNNQFSKHTKSMAQRVIDSIVLKKIGLSLALLVAVSVIVATADTRDRGVHRISITGQSDWSIVPANLTAPFVFVGSDSNYYVRHLPLVGKITLAGRDIEIVGKISADFNAELDATFSGPVWAPMTITGKVNGKTVLLFEGSATGDTVQLVSTGVMKLEGCGPFEGAKLELEFKEIGPGSTDIYELKGDLFDCVRR